MIKKLLSAVIFIGSASLLSATVIPNDDSILAGVKQLNEEQMQSVTGENVYIYRYYLSMNLYELVSVYVSDQAHGYVCTDVERGTTDIRVLTGTLEELKDEDIQYTPPGYHD